MSSVIAVADRASTSFRRTAERQEDSLPTPGRRGRRSLRAGGASCAAGPEALESSGSMPGDTLRTTHSPHAVRPARRSHAERRTRGGTIHSAQTLSGTVRHRAQPLTGNHRPPRTAVGPPRARYVRAPATPVRMAFRAVCGKWSGTARRQVRSPAARYRGHRFRRPDVASLGRHAAGTSCGTPFPATRPAGQRLTALSMLPPCQALTAEPARPEDPPLPYVHIAPPGGAGQAAPSDGW